MDRLGAETTGPGKVSLSTKCIAQNTPPHEEHLYQMHSRPSYPHDELKIHGQLMISGIIGQVAVAVQKTGLGEIHGDLLEVDFEPASKSAIKCRIRSAVTRAEAEIAIATPLHR